MVASGSGSESAEIATVGVPTMPNRDISRSREGRPKFPQCKCTDFIFCEIVYISRCRGMETIINLDISALEFYRERLRKSGRNATHLDLVNDIFAKCKNDTGKS